MLLIGVSHSFSKKEGCRNTVKRAVALALLLLINMDCGEAGQEACVMELRVYDGFGNRLEFRVTRVSPEDKPEINLLTKVPKYITSTGDRLSFTGRSFTEHSLRGRVVVITLEDAKGRKVVKPVVLLDCPQRISIRYGQSDLGIDVDSVPVTGRVSGCRFVGDWWVRVLPMFGAQNRDYVVNGYVQSDGTFRLSAAAEGVRHLLVIGKGKQPIKVIGFDVTLGKTSDIGVVDLSGQCPQ